MPGPDPKNTSVRQRRNVKSTKAILRALDPDEPLEIPEMPKVYKNQVDKDVLSPTYGEVILVETTYEMQTLMAWEAWWSSPMRQEWTQADYFGLCRLIVLEDQFWKSPSGQAHAEIRLAQKDYGITPLDRRRLEWTVEQTDKAQSEGEKRRRKQAVENTPTAAPPPSDDPRRHIAS